VPVPKSVTAKGNKSDGSADELGYKRWYKRTGEPAGGVGGQSTVLAGPGPGVKTATSQNSK